MMDYDPEKMLSIVSNLLSNAIKFTSRNGDVYIIFEKITANGSPHFQFTVKDTGVGIAEDKLQNIFNRFYQVDAETTRKAEGMGIGLALTKELVQIQGGNISAKSELGQGSEFTVLLPITNKSTSQHLMSTYDSESSERRSDLETTTAIPVKQNSSLATENQPIVLIVEDNKDVQNYLKSCLQDHFLIEVANDGKEGIERSTELIPDLIITDIMMPNIDGFELCSTIKTNFKTSHIPIIILTAKADSESRIEGLEHGADAYLYKPFDKKELEVRVSKLIENRKKCS